MRRLLYLCCFVLLVASCPRPSTSQTTWAPSPAYQPRTGDITSSATLSSLYLPYSDVVQMGVKETRVSYCAGLQLTLTAKMIEQQRAFVKQCQDAGAEAVEICIEYEGQKVQITFDDLLKRVGFTPVKPIKR